MKPFISENNAIIQIFLCTIVKGASVKEEFCRDFDPLETICFAGSQQNVTKS